MTEWQKIKKMFLSFQIYCNHDLTKPIGHCQTTNFIETIISLSNLLVCVNSSGNFLFYMLRGKKFRDAFYQTYVRLLCRCCKKTPRSGDSPLGSLSLASHQLCSVRKMNQVKKRRTSNLNSISMLKFQSYQVFILCRQQTQAFLYPQLFIPHLRHQRESIVVLDSGI